ncbi:MAG: hypothetical protein ACP5I8_14990 [Phycisphaerae bacterium]
MSMDIGHLISELSDWNNGTGITVESWISGIGRYDHFLGYISIVWPEFILYDDCVFRSSPDPKTYHGFMEMFHGNKMEVERVMNHEHVADMFMNKEFSLTEEIVIFIGTRLQQMWSCKLSRDFPGRIFTVEFITDKQSDEVEEDPLLRYMVTFSCHAAQRRS